MTRVERMERDTGWVCACEWNGKEKKRKEINQAREKGETEEWRLSMTVVGGDRRVCGCAWTCVPFWLRLCGSVCQWCVNVWSRENA